MKHGKTQRINQDLFLYDELEITDELYIERAQRVRRTEDVKFNSSNTLRTIVAKFLDYKEKGEVMRRRYKLTDTTYSVREDFSKETVEIRKKLWDQVKKLREDGKYAVIKYDKIEGLSTKTVVCAFRSFD